MYLFCNPIVRPFIRHLGDLYINFVITLLVQFSYRKSITRTKVVVKRDDANGKVIFAELSIIINTLISFNFTKTNGK